MEKKDKKKLFFAFLLILLVAVFVDATSGELSQKGIIERNELGEKEKEVNLTVEIEGILEEQDFVLEVEPELVTKEVAEKYFSQAISEIDESFSVKDGELEIENAYASELVEAEWSFSPAGYVNEDGILREEKIPEEGVLLQVTVELSCGNYEQLYIFPFFLEKPAISEEQQVLSALEQVLQDQMLLEGTRNLQLPSEINGHPVVWSEKKDYITGKILLLEVVAVVLLVFMEKQKKEKEQENRKCEIELDYPDVVNQLSILLEAGMTTRQAWNRMASQYEEKKKAAIIRRSLVFEEIVTMNHRLIEGENERVAYEGFLREIDHPLYRRLMRMLVNNLEKGAKGICEYLEEESRQAYEQRITLAKKLGEEASTKMLIPMMLMMVLVMAIVMVPALISFSL